LSESSRKTLKTVAENRSELGDRMGQASETGFKEKPTGVLRTDLRRGANCVTDREKSTSQIDYGCRLVDDRVPLIVNESLHITEKLTFQSTEEQRSTKEVRQALLLAETV